MVNKPRQNSTPRETFLYRAEAGVSGGIRASRTTARSTNLIISKVKICIKYGRKKWYASEKRSMDAGERSGPWRAQRTRCFHGMYMARKKYVRQQKILDRAQDACKRSEPVFSRVKLCSNI